MTPQQVSTFFAILAIIAAAGAVAIFGIQIAWRGTQRLADLRETQWQTALLGAAIVAWVAALGSLYLSEVAHFSPCMWCWYQRIAMYPIGPMLLFAWFRRDASIKPYVLLIAVAGAMVSIWHVLVEIYPTLEATSCKIGIPCSISPVQPLGGAFTVPRMALCGFVAIIAALTLVPTPPVAGRDAALD